MPSVQRAILQRCTKPSNSGVAFLSADFIKLSLITLTLSIYLCVDTHASSLRIRMTGYLSAVQNELSRSDISMYFTHSLCMPIQIPFPADLLLAARAFMSAIY